MKELAAALCKAQAQIEGAKKDSTNPHFKNKYADLGSVWDACREALTANGLSIVQTGELVDGQWALATTLIHESGQAHKGYVPLLNGKGDMQGLGSALTYARRYGLAAMVGVCPEDDDGNAASEKPKAAKAESVEMTKPKGYDAWLKMMHDTADLGNDALMEAWKGSPVDFRAYIQPAERDALKAKAKAAA